MDELREQVAALGALAKQLFEQQFIRCGGRKPGDPTWDELEEFERDEWWDRARDAAPLIDAERSSRQAWAEEAIRLEMAWGQLAEEMVGRGHQRDQVDGDDGDPCEEADCQDAVSCHTVAAVATWFRAAHVVRSRLAEALDVSRPVCAVHPDTVAEHDGIPSDLQVAPNLGAGGEIDPAWLAVGGDPLSGTPWADPEYKGGGVE